MKSGLPSRSLARPSRHCPLSSTSNRFTRRIQAYPSLERQHHPIHARGIRLGARVACAYGEALQVVVGERMPGGCGQRFGMQAGIAKDSVVLGKLANRWGTKFAGLCHGAGNIVRGVEVAAG